MAEALRDPLKELVQEQYNEAYKACPIDTRVAAYSAGLIAVAETLEFDYVTSGSRVEDVRRKLFGFSGLVVNQSRLVRPPRTSGLTDILMAIHHGYTYVHTKGMVANRRGADVHWISMNPYTLTTYTSVVDAEQAINRRDLVIDDGDNGVVSSEAELTVYGAHLAAFMNACDVPYESMFIDEPVNSIH